MENNFNGALEDISIIKKSINSGKVNLKAIYKLFLINAIINTLYVFTYNIIGNILLRNKEVSFVGKFHFNNYIVFLILNIAFFVYYLITYKKEKFSTNKYYVSFLSLFGVIKFIIPFFIRVFTTLGRLENGTYDNYGALLNSENIIKGTISILFLYLCLNLLGLIVNKKIYNISSIIILLGYFAVVIFLGNKSEMLTVSNVMRDTYYSRAYLLFLNLIVSLVMPITLKIEERRNYGNN